MARGDRTGALAAYRTHAPSLSAGSPEGRSRLRALQERVLFSAPPPALPTNLPHSQHVLLGRASEEAAVARALRAHRIVTLTGAAGIGKTRIALEAGRRLLLDWDGGVWWAEMGSINDGAFCAAHVIGALGGAGGAQDESGLLHYLADRSALLIFDRCEHIALDVSKLAMRIVSSCPAVRILCTSRQALGASAETEIRIEPLELPVPKETGRSAIMRSPAVQMFVERASMLDIRFAVTDANASQVAQLCRKLDGVPLALELAASWVLRLPLGEIAARLGAIEPTLATAIASSCELIDPAGRTVLDALTFFVAPFSLEEAECASGSEGAQHVRSLIDASLVHVRAHEGALRYVLLDSTRDFLLKHVARGTGTDAARRLLRFYAQLQEEQMEPVVENLMHACKVLLHDAESAQSRFALLARASGLLGRWHVGEFAGLCEETLDAAPGESRESAAYGALLRSMAWFDNRLGHFARAIDRTNAALAVLRLHGARGEEIRALTNLYIIAVNIGDYASAHAAAREALVLSRATGDASAIGNALRAAAGIFVAEGRFAEALPLYEEFLALDLDKVRKPVLAMALHDNALARLYLGQPKAARALAQRSREISAAAGDSGTEADACSALGITALIESNLEDALEFFHEAVRLSALPGSHPITFARALEGCAACCIRDDQLETVAHIAGFTAQLLARISAPRQPFERPRYDAMIAAISSRMGMERFEAALLVGRTRSQRDIAAAALSLMPANAPPERALRFGSLSAREREVAEAAAGGRSNREIADTLHLSVRTVENHLAAIYKKLGVRTRSELMQ